MAELLGVELRPSLPPGRGVLRIGSERLNAGNDRDDAKLSATWWNGAGAT
jgi:hypothetical protein